MKIICMVCGEEVEETLYPEHMTIHGGVGNQRKAMAEEKSKQVDIPKMIPLDKEAPPPAEMQEVLQAIEQGVPPVPMPVVPTPAAPKPNVPEVAGVPLKLKYVWEGNCPQDNSPVRTVITKIDGRWFATAYCLSHGELEQQEVEPLGGDTNAIQERKTEKVHVRQAPRNSKKVDSGTEKEGTTSS